MKKVLSLLFVIVLLMTSTTSVFATTTSEEDIKVEVVNYMIAVNSQIGYFMNDEEELILSDQVQVAAETYSFYFA